MFLFVGVIEKCYIVKGYITKILSKHKNYYGIISKEY